MQDFKTKHFHMDSNSVLDINRVYMMITEYNEDNIENDEDGIFVISQKFQEIAQQGLDRFVQLSILNSASCHYII